MKRQISGDNKNKNSGKSSSHFPPVCMSLYLYVCVYEYGGVRRVYKYQMESFQRDKFNWRQFVAKHMREKLATARKKYELQLAGQAQKWVKVSLALALPMAWVWGRGYPYLELAY